MRSHLPIQLFTVAALASAAAAQTIDAFGLPNTPRGNANLAYDPAARRLVVSGIGSSGQDGVSFEGGLQYAVYYGRESLDSIADGGSIETQVRLNGLPPGTRYIGNRVMHTGPTWTITGTALGIGAGGFFYLVLDHGQATGRVFVANGGDAVASSAPIGGSAGPTFASDPDPGPAGTDCDPWETLQWTCTSANGTTCGVSWGSSPSAALSACCSGAGGTLVSKCGIQSFAGFRFPDATTFTIGPITCAGDTLLLVADVTGDAHSIAMVDVIGKDLGPAGTPGSFTLTSEAIEFDDFLVASLGDAQIHAETDATGARRLPVNNIGASGQDGVEVDLRAAKSAQLNISASPGGAPVGSHLECHIHGIRDGIDGQPIGSMRYRQGQGFFDVFADFSDIGSLTHRVVLLNQGAVVLDLPGQTGQVCTTSAGPMRIGDLDLPSPCLVAYAPIGTQFTVQGALYLADELRVLADSATLPVSATTSARLYGRDILLVCRGISTVGTDLPNGQSYCYGDGSGTPCPCGNSGAPGHGCMNSVNASGAVLEAHGIARLSADSLVLTGSGMPNGTALYFQGTATVNGGLGNPFGDGLRCAGTNIRRLGTKQNVLGTSSYPGGGDPPISVQGQILAPGGRRYYQVWYRNAASFCTASTFNLSNGMWSDWEP